jgi:hypothetical protein
MDSDSKGTPAAYVPFSTFETALDKLGTFPTMPPRIDSTVFPSFGGQAKGQVISALRFFKLIDANGIPSPALRELAKNKEGRKDALRLLIKEHYPNISEDDLAGSSPAQLDGKLSDKMYGISGDTKQKARSFLLKAAESAGMPISTLLKARGPRGPRPKRAKNSKTNGSTSAKIVEKAEEMLEDDDAKGLTRMPVPLSLGRVAYVLLPNDWDSEKDAKKLLSVLGLTFDVSVQVS